MQVTAEAPDYTLLAARLSKDCLLFEGIPEGAVLACLLGCPVRRWTREETIVRRHSPGDSVFVVVDGEAVLIAPEIGGGAGVPSAKSRSLDTRRYGDTFGEIVCLEDNGMRTADIRAGDHCQTLEIPRERWLDLIHKWPSAAVATARQLARRVRAYTNEVTWSEAAGAELPHVADLLSRRREGMPEETRKWEDFGDRWLKWVSSPGFLALHVNWWLVHVLIWLVCLILGFKIEGTILNFLTMAVSLEAIVLSIFVLVSQRRAEEDARVRDGYYDLVAGQAREMNHRILREVSELGAALRGKSGGAS